MNSGRVLIGRINLNLQPIHIQLRHQQPRSYIREKIQRPSGVEVLRRNL